MSSQQLLTAANYFTSDRYSLMVSMPPLIHISIIFFTFCWCLKLIFKYFSTKNPTQCSFLWCILNECLHPLLLMKCNFCTPSHDLLTSCVLLGELWGCFRAAGSEGEAEMQQFWLVSEEYLPWPTCAWGQGWLARSCECYPYLYSTNHPITIKVQCVNFCLILFPNVLRCFWTGLVTEVQR